MLWLLPVAPVFTVIVVLCCPGLFVVCVLFSAVPPFWCRYRFSTVAVLFPGKAHVHLSIHTHYCRVLGQCISTTEVMVAQLNDVLFM